MEDLWIGVLQQLVTTVSGVAFIGLSTISGIYVKKLITTLQRKNLKIEIDSFVKAAEQSPSFKDYSGEQKYEVVRARAITWGKDNNVTLTDDELMVLIESSVKEMKLEGQILRASPKEKEEELKTEDAEKEEEIVLHVVKEKNSSPGISKDNQIEAVG